MSSRQCKIVCNLAAAAAAEGLAALDVQRIRPNHRSVAQFLHHTSTSQASINAYRSLLSSRLTFYSTDGLRGLLCRRPTTRRTSSGSARPQYKPKQSRALLEAKAECQKRLRAPRRKLLKSDKLACAFEASARRGGLAFTLNLSPDRESFLRGRSNPRRAMQKRIEVN